MLEETNKQVDDGGGPVTPTHHPIMPVQCISYLPKGPRRKNVRWATSKKANIKRMTSLYVFYPPHNGKLSIVGGGPSVNETYKDIKGDVMVCGSCHDHAIRLGIKPTYVIECDPHTNQKQFYTEKSDAKYFIASRCDKSTFLHLRDRDVYLWHMWEGDLGKPVYRGEKALNCGATVLLSAIPLALSLSYGEFNFYGVDSSFPDPDQHHAYPCPEEATKMVVRVGNPDTGKEFHTTATWVGQAQQYQQMCQMWGFKGTFHGDGMLAEMERQAGRQV